MAKRAERVYPKIREDQLAALRAYAAWAGSEWVERLLSDWRRAGTEWPQGRRDDLYCLLHQIRNSHGPRWLTVWGEAVASGQAVSW